MKIVKFKFKNGIEVQDKVTGVKAIINGQAIWLNGCKQYSLQPKAKKDSNEVPQSYWIDEAQLIKTGPGISVEQKETGGPSTPSNYMNH